ncbi:M23 family metallopeptidase [Thermodesulfobacteriota bacterium]
MKGNAYTLLLIPESKGNTREFAVRKFTLISIAALFVFLFVCTIMFLHLNVRHKTLKYEYDTLQIQKLSQDMTVQRLQEQLEDVEKFTVSIGEVLGVGADTSEVGGGKGGPSIPQEFGISIKALFDQVNANAGIDSLYHRSSSLNRNLALIWEEIRKRNELLAHTPSIWPIEQENEYWVASSFGRRISPFTGLPEIHEGLDIVAKKGTPVIAPADGVVRNTGKKKLLGGYVVLDHGYGYETVFGHLQDSLVKKGDEIDRHQVIGYIGSTGRSTGPHLHYEVRREGVKVNPFRYILN